MLARSGTPAEIVTRLNAEIARIVKSPEAAEPLRVAGVDPVGGDVEETAAAMRKENERIVKAARHAGIKPE